MMKNWTVSTNCRTFWTSKLVSPHWFGLYFVSLRLNTKWNATHLLSHLSPLTLEIAGAPQMTLQQYLSTLPCLPLATGNRQTPFPSIPWCYLPISSSSFLFLSLSPTELSSPCQRILVYGHTIWVTFFTMVRRSSCTPVAFWILLRTLFIRHMVCWISIYSCKRNVSFSCMQHALQIQ